MFLWGDESQLQQKILENACFEGSANILFFS